MALSLSSGWCLKIVNSDAPIIHENAILQVLYRDELDARPGNPSSRRWRLVLSDGQHYVQCVTTPNLNHLCDEDKTVPGSTVKVSRIAWGQEGPLGRVLVILGMRYAGDRVLMIGKPTAARRSTLFPAQQIPQPGRSTSTHEKPVFPQTPRKAINSISASGNSRTLLSPSTPTTQHGVGTPATVARTPATPTTPSSSDDAPVTDLADLSDFTVRPIIKAAVKEKGDIQSWSNDRRSGTLLRITLQDKSGEMRATAWGNDAKKFHSMVEEGTVYRISKVKVKRQDKRFYREGQSEFELTLDNNTAITKCEDPGDTPTGRYRLRDLAQLEDLEVGVTCDLLAYVVLAEELKSTSSSERRHLTLIDHTTSGVRLTLWGKEAEAWDHDAPVMVFCRNLKVNQFAGVKQLDAGRSKSIRINPDIPGSEMLRRWFETRGQFIPASQPLSQKKHVTTVPGLHTLKEVSELYESDDGVVAFSARVTVMHIKSERVTVAGCPRCRKKVFKSAEAEVWQCESCQMNHDTPQYRYWFMVKMSDFTGCAHMWADDHSGPLLLGGMSADELEAQKTEDDDSVFLATLRKAQSYQYDVTFQVSLTEYNGFSQRHYAIKQIQRTDYVANHRQLFGLLKGI